MRINWTSPLAKASLMIPCLGFSVVAWPVATMVLLSSLPEVRSTEDDRVGMFVFFAMIVAGLFMGIHAGMMIDEPAVWLRSKGKRTVFLIVSALFAACITYVNSTGIVLNPKDPAAYVLLYFFVVQSPPLLWFLFNLHGESWLKTFARRRHRQIY